MPTAYEYRCRECGTSITAWLRLDAGILSKYSHTDEGELVYNGPHNGPALDVCPGEIKRCWSGGFVWPKENRGH